MYAVVVMGLEVYICDVVDVVGVAGFSGGVDLTDFRRCPRASII